MRKRTAVSLVLGLVTPVVLAQQGCAGVDGDSCQDRDLASCGPDASVAHQATTPDGGDASLDTSAPPPGADGGEDAMPSDDAGPDAADSGPTCTATFCGDDAGCVDTTTSVSNCGTCGHACPGAANGSATCTASKCSIGCDDPSFSERVKTRSIKKPAFTSSFGT